MSTTKKTTTKKKSPVKKSSHHTAGAAGIGALLAAAAGAYFLYGSKDAAKNRKKITGWALKLKGEVLEQIEKTKSELNEERYHEIIDNVERKYRALKEVENDELAEVVKDLKKHWKNIKKHIDKA